MLDQLPRHHGTGFRIGDMPPKRTGHIVRRFRRRNQFAQPRFIERTGIVGDEHQEFTGGQGTAQVARPPMAKARRCNAFDPATLFKRIQIAPVGRTGVNYQDFKRPRRLLRHGLVENPAKTRPAVLERDDY